MTLGRRGGLGARRGNQRQLSKTNIGETGRKKFQGVRAGQLGKQATPSFLSLPQRINTRLNEFISPEAFIGGAKIGLQAGKQLVTDPVGTLGGAIDVLRHGSFGKQGQLDAQAARGSRFLTGTSVGRAFAQRGLGGAIRQLRFGSKFKKETGTRLINFP